MERDCRFEHLAYFGTDPESVGAKLLFNRTATFRDAWAKIEQQQKSR